MAHDISILLSAEVEATVPKAILHFIDCNTLIMPLPESSNVEILFLIDKIRETQEVDFYSYRDDSDLVKMLYDIGLQTFVLYDRVYDEYTGFVVKNGQVLLDTLFEGGSSFRDIVFDQLEIDIIVAESHRNYWASFQSYQPEKN